MKHTTLLFISLLALPCGFLSAQKIIFPRPDQPTQTAPPAANGPNLIVSKLTLNLVETNKIKYTFDITNTGNQPASMANITVQAHLYKLLDGQGSKIPAGGFTLTGISTLAPGQTIQRSFQPSFSSTTAAYGSLCVVIDFNQVLAETQEGDNDLCVRLQAGATVLNVDLHPVTDFSSNLQVFKKAETPNLVYFKIRNDGPVKAFGTQAIVEYGTYGATPLTKQLLVPEIPPYSSATLSLEFPEYTCKRHFIQLTCDSGKNIPETDERNNTLKTQHCED